MPGSFVPGCFCRAALHELSNRNCHVLNTFYCDVGALLFGLCTCEKSRVTALTDRMWSLRSG